MDFVRSHLRKPTSDQLYTFFLRRKKVFNWSEVHLSEVTSSKIHILDCYGQAYSILRVPFGLGISNFVAKKVARKSPLKSRQKPHGVRNAKSKQKSLTAQIFVFN